MSDVVKPVLFYVVIFLANIMQAITGFAGTVLAMPFSIVLVGSETARTVLNLLGIAASIGVVAINFRKIRWKEVLKICLIMLVGMAIGYVIIAFVPVPKQILYYVLAAFVLVFTAIGIYTTFFQKEKPEKNTSVLSEILLLALLVVAGIVHGMFVCGGPLLVLYATKKLKERDEFRATLSMSWIVLNTTNLLHDVFTGKFVFGDVTHTLTVLGISLAVLIVAILVGNAVAKKLNKKAFLLVTYILMAISAVSLILNAVGII